MSSVWMWQFQMPSPPTTTMESPTSVHACLKPATEESGASSRNITSYWRSAMEDSSIGRAALAEATGVGPAATLGGAGMGRPSNSARQASSSSSSPAPPASTTPASASTVSISGVRASASYPWARAASSTSTRPPPASAATRAASDASRMTVRIVPSTGRATAV